jgi:hypothetical protein
MIDHDIVGLHISVHDTLAVTEVQRLKELINVEADIIVREARVQGPEISVVDCLKDQAGSLALVVPNNVEQSYDVGAASKILENLDLSLDLLLLHGLEDLDNAFLVVDDVDAFEYLRVLASTNLANDLVVLKDTPGNVHTVIVPVGSWHVLVDIGVDARHGDCRRLPNPPTIEIRCGGVTRGCSLVTGDGGVEGR